MCSGESIEYFRVLNIGDRARTSTNLLLRMKLRWSERPNLGLPPERYGWSPREKLRATEDQARGARIRQEMLLAEERVKRLEDHLKRSIDESKDRILRMKLRLEEEEWRRYEQTLPTPTEDNSERRAPEDDYQTGANYVDYSQTPAYTPVPKSVYESSSPRLRSSTNWVDYSQMPTAPERPRSYYSGGHEEDLLKRKVRASTPMRDYERPHSYYSGGHEEDLLKGKVRASTPMRDYERPRSYYSGGHEEDLLKRKVRASTPMRDYERPRSYYSGGHEEDLLKGKVRASTPMRDYKRPRSYYSGGREEDLFDRETRASTPIRDYEDGFHTGFRHEPPPERPRMTDDKADGITKLAEALAGILDSRKLSHVGHDDSLRRYVARQAIDDKETDSCPATMSENGEAEVGDTSAKESMDSQDSMEVSDLSESGGSKQTDNEQAAQNGEDPPVSRNAEPDSQATVITGEPMDASLESSEMSVRNESLVDNADTDTDTDVHEDEDSGNDEEWYNAESDHDLEEVTEARTIEETDESEGPSSKEAKLKHTAEKRKNPDRALSEPAASASKKDKAGSKTKGGASVQSTLTGFISRTSSAPRLRSTWSSHDTDSLQGFNKLDAIEHEDDCVSSVNVNEEMETFCTLSSRIMVKAGMELRKVRSDALCPGNDKPLRGPTVLVVTWDPTSDALSVCLRAEDVKGYAARTRSLLLRMAEAHFDTGRVLMQLAWRETTECDKTFSSSRSLSARVSAWWGETNELELQATCMATKQLVQQYFIPFVVLYFWRLWMQMKDARMKNSSLLDSESSLFNASRHLPGKQQSLPIP